MGTTKLRAEKEKVGKSKEKEKKPVKPITERSTEVRAITRVIGTDLDGEDPLMKAIQGIKGISHTLSKAICVVSGFDPHRKLGSLNEGEIKKLEDIIKNPANYGLPIWIFNRRKDMASGKDLHLSGSDVDIAKKFDIQKEVDLRSYKGFRHMMGQPVRGQRTRSHFRIGKEVGVVRKAVRVATGKEPEKKEEKKK